MSYIKEAYFHIKGTPTKETTDMNIKRNYIMATLDYTKGKGYTWSMRPIGQHTVKDEKYGDAVMNVISYGLFSSIHPEIWRECLVECGRRGKAKEREAVELFEKNVVSAITDRLGYDIEIDEEMIE